ncbi:hypothetical protein EKE94_03275 [Mesobaculum littorinae]|uniref:DUF1376 domain-containing protein n=1 Tax=Mesobaculum littorinae TaxID=2486419 RepID=A0A438AMX8_9RHOB|nr:hypothetical protein EKE94_03275 [Mesobaculum littorinae]
MVWHHRRWLNSDMRLKATEEARALFFDLICLSQDQTPIGTLPDDMELIAKLLHVDQARLERLSDMRFGPLHKWTRCRCDDEIRLWHPMVLEMVQEALSRRENNRASNEAANAKKRRQRLRSTIAGFHADLAKNDAAVLWIDDWLQQHCDGYRTAEWYQRAMAAWANQQFDPARARQVG